MTSKERVILAFHHQEPDRVPTWCGASVEFWDKAKRELGLEDEELRLRLGDDFRRVHARYVGPNFALSPGATCRTPFGVERRGMGYGQPLNHPLQHASLKEIHDYAWPNPAWMDVSHIRSEAKELGGDHAVLGGDWSPFWHDAIDLLGMETMYLKMYDDPDLVDAVLSHMVDYYAKVSERIFDAAGDCIDIFFIGNDLGSQTGPLLGLDLFRRFILPHIERLVRLGHAYDLKVMMHCCGGFRPLIQDLVDTGLDGLHAIQPSCRGMDLVELKKDFGDKILFNGCIDSHRVLIDGTPASVRNETRKVMDIMKPGGGFVAGASHDTILEETPVENVLSMFDTILHEGRY